MRARRVGPVLDEPEARQVEERRGLCIGVLVRDFDVEKPGGRRMSGGGRDGTGSTRVKVRDVLSLFELDLGDLVCARDRDREVFVGADVSLQGCRGNGSEQGCLMHATPAALLWTAEGGSPHAFRARRSSG